MKNKKRLRDVCTVGLAAALLCVAAPVAIPVGSVPMTLATLVILIAAGILGPWKGSAAVMVYLMLGCLGLPVFSGFYGGVGHIAGPTGGFILGYILLAVAAGLGRGKVLPMILGNVALYAVGTVWYTVYANLNMWAALFVCVVPYLPLDAVKIAVAAVTVRRVRASAVRSEQNGR